MAKLSPLPAINQSRHSGADAQQPQLRTRFYAFISYSHKDKELADWLHRELEKFHVPHALAGKLTANGVVPPRLTPIFRDQHDLPASGDLAEEIRAALAGSQFLIVLCSPTAAKSRWTNQEIETFKRTRPEACVLAAIVAGEPFASGIQGKEGEECFPPALRYKYDRRGHQTNKLAEPMAADFRDTGEGKRLAFLKLVAGMLGIGLDELVQREQTRRHRYLAYIAAASLAGVLVTSTLALTAFQARNEAREQRRHAEGLVAFMLGDLKNKLEPIGKLDALDGVAARVLDYYKSQDASALTDAGLSQRSGALSLMAEVADARGDTGTSLKLYRQAMAGTSEAIRRTPNDPQALFEHAQNVFYVGEIAQNDGDLRAAEYAMREYQRLARRMVALQPDSMKYRMELQYADTNLGVVLSDQRQFSQAVVQFDDALRTMEAIATADPLNDSYRESVAESLAWLADGERAIGNYDRAIALRQRNVAIYNQLFTQSADVKYRQQIIPAMRSLGTLYAERGELSLAVQQFRSSVAQAEKLKAVEPNNALWTEYDFRARIALAKLLLAMSQANEAAAQTLVACDGVHSLMSRPVIKPEWRIGLFGCLTLQAKLSLKTGVTQNALTFANNALAAAKSVHTADRFADSSGISRAYRLLGDIQRQRGEIPAARASWLAALAAVPSGAVEQPDEIAEHVAILQRLGRASEAQPLAKKLNSIGFTLLT